MFNCDTSNREFPLPTLFATINKGPYAIIEMSLEQFKWGIRVLQCQNPPTIKKKNTYIVHVNIQIQFQFALTRNSISVYRLWPHGSQDRPWKDFLYDLCGGWNSTRTDNVSIHRRTAEHIFGAHVSTRQEKARDEKHRGVKHGESRGPLRVAINGCYSVLWRVYL